MRQPKWFGELRLAAAEPLAKAVLATYHDNVQSEKLSGFTADDVVWTENPELQTDLFRRAREEWCRLTRKPFTSFPFSSSYVVRLYARFRDCDDKERARWASALALIGERKRKPEEPD
jgi:hypothetical protein